jgi:hypothetical protein
MLESGKRKIPELESDLVAKYLVLVLIACYLIYGIQTARYGSYMSQEVAQC